MIFLILSFIYICYMFSLPILCFTIRDEPPKPTVALEYTFGRRAKGHNIVSILNINEVSLYACVSWKNWHRGEIGFYLHQQFNVCLSSLLTLKAMLVILFAGRLAYDSAKGSICHLSCQQKSLFIVFAKLIVIYSIERDVNYHI